MASERPPVESATKNTQVQRSPSPLSAAESATQAGEHLPQQEEPSAAAEAMIPVSTDLVPYYAKSKIREQKPSDSSVSDMFGPRTTDEVLTNERLASSLQTPMPTPDGQIPEVQVPGVQVMEYLSPWYQFLLSRKRPR
ncbi:hypothetical protein ABVK25_011001 [Lepraria finkii]|uniref:Uncharacterized protein n=1 Tax=Lepraria finkii TaxID=1340010 RepID=A0ABR4ASR4_9LECA